MSPQFDKIPESPFPISSYSISHSPWVGSIQRIIQAALQAADPYIAVRKRLFRSGNILQIGKHRYSLRKYRRIRILGMGKACIPMAVAVYDMLVDCITDGLLVVKTQPSTSSPSSSSPVPVPFPIIKSSHPIPDERSQHAGSAIKTFLLDSRSDDLVICLISGGSSALVVSPVPDVDLPDIQMMTRLLLACGANIQEINTLRKHLDDIKGGGLARCAYPARLLTLVLSDVLGDPLETIASGPAYPDPSTYQDAWNLLVKYHLTEQLPDRIIRIINHGLQGQRAETPKPGDLIFRRVHHVIVGNNRMAAQAALRQAKQEGFHSQLLTSSLQGEARQAGIFLASIARELSFANSPLRSPSCMVVGGETTVTLAGNGLGGRNQELALGAVNHLAALSNILLVTLATDGEDGPTDAAGAVVTGETLERAQNAALNPQEYLKNNDSYDFFSNLNDLLVTGPTQTNVNDLVLLFHFNG
jgi:glycerate 2-kinase